MSSLVNQTWRVVYRNWRGETALRTVRVRALYVGSTQYHRHRQLLMRVYDYDRRAERVYAARDVTVWGERVGA